MQVVFGLCLADWRIIFQTNLADSLLICGHVRGYHHFEES